MMIQKLFRKYLLRIQQFFQAQAFNWYLFSFSCSKLFHKCIESDCHFGGYKMNLQFYSKNFLIFIRKMHIKQRCKHEYLNRQDVNVFPFNLFFFFLLSRLFSFQTSDHENIMKALCTLLCRSQKSTLLLFISMQMRGKCIHLLLWRSLICIHILIYIFPNDLSSSTRSLSLSHSLFVLSQRSDSEFTSSSFYPI